MTNAIIKTESAITCMGVKARAFGVVANTETGRILNQKIGATRNYTKGENKYRITVELCFDDQCGNGHESFAITADIRENGRQYMGGCCHDEIAQHFPEFAPLIKWHLTSTDGPMHYVANTMYHAADLDAEHTWGKAKPANLEYARSTAVWPDATIEQLRDKAALEARLPALLAEFKAAMLSAGFLWPEEGGAK